MQRVAQRLKKGMKIRLNYEVNAACMNHDPDIMVLHELMIIMITMVIHHLHQPNVSLHRRAIYHVASSRVVLVPVDAT